MVQCLRSKRPVPHLLGAESVELRVLGAHNQESRTTRLVSLLVDDVLALDAGALTSTLSLPEQRRIEALLLTHRHYDHIRDLPILALNTLDCGATLPVYAPDDAILHLPGPLHGWRPLPRVHPSPPPRRPRASSFAPQWPLVEERVAGYRILPVAVPHRVPSLGYQVESQDGRRLFYSGDATSGLSRVWDSLDPHLMVLEVTWPNRMEERAMGRHLTPTLLRRELETYVAQRGALPPILQCISTPELETELRRELAEVARALQADITPAEEGMLLEV